MIGRTYPFLREGYVTEKDEMFFIFLSHGHKVIPKLVVFSPVEKNGVKYYNWGFGDLTIERDGYRANDKVESNNGDFKTVFYTVISTLVVFFERFPREVVHISGSSSQRMEIYRRLVARHWKQIEISYDVNGFINDRVEPFSAGLEFEYLLISKKNA